MKEEDKEKIRILKKKNREYINIQRSQLQKELEDQCVLLKGHDFFNWIDTSFLNVSGNYIKQFTRECIVCSKKEYKRE